VKAPPKYLRPITPYWFLGLLERFFGLCYCKMVLWKMDYLFIDDWNVDDECFAGHPDGWDYCGKYPPKGEEWFNERWPERKITKETE